MADILSPWDRTIGSSAIPKTDAIKNDPVCMPEDVIAISKWGDGNYFLEDRQIGVTLKITPALYWELVEKAQEVFEVAELNGWRADK